MTESVTLKTVGDWSAKIEVPLSNALSASVELLGWSGYKACEKAIVYMAGSAAKLTKSSPKLRKVVENPDPRWKKDRRRAKYGVMKWKDGQQYFVPIYRTGEYGKIRFLSKKKAEWLVYDKYTKEVRKEQWDTGTGEFQIAGIMQSKKRIIGRRGLAKKSWMWGIKGFHPEAIPDVTDLKPILSAVQCGLVLTNRIRYLSKITPSNLVEEVSRRASDSIMRQAASAVERKFSVEVPRLAAQRAKKAAKNLPTEFMKGAS